MSVICIKEHRSFIVGDTYDFSRHYNLQNEIVIGVDRYFPNCSQRTWFTPEEFNTYFSTIQDRRKRIIKELK